MTNGLKQKWIDHYINDCNIEGTNPPPINDRCLYALSLFSGIGGIDIACELNNIRTVAFCEINEYGQSILKLRWENAYIVGKDKKIDGGIPIFSDVTKLSAKRTENGEVILYYEKQEEARFNEIHVIQGGFPCQDYSVMGARQGNDGIRALFGELCRLVYEIHPRWIIGENVVGFKSLGLDSLLKKFDALRYDSRTFCYPASLQNAPIHRYRVFIVGFDRDFDRRKTRVDEGSGDGRRRIEEYQSELGKSGKTIREGIERTRVERSSTEAPAICTNASSNGQRNVREEREIWSKLNTGSYNGKNIFESGLDRVANGDGRKVSTQGKSRVRALGNAVNPIQLYPLVRYLKYVDDLILDGDERIMLHDQVREEAENLIEEIKKDGRLDKIKENFWATKVEDDIEKLFSAKKDYRPYKVYARVQCNPTLCKNYGANYRAGSKKQLYCDPDNMKDLPFWIETDIINVWKSNLDFVQILFGMDKSAGKEKKLFQYLRNAEVVEEAWKQLVESGSLCWKPKENMEDAVFANKTLRRLAGCNCDNTSGSNINLW